MRSRRLWSLSRFGFLLLAWIAGVIARAAEPSLTSVAAIQELSPEQAAARHPVDLQGVVLVADYGGFVLHDGQRGLYVTWRHDAVPPFAAQVRVHGVTAAGDYAPVVQATAVERLGPGALPQPVVATPRELSSGRLDCQWVQVEGTIRNVEPAPYENDFYPTYAAISTDAGRLEMTFCATPYPTAKGWTDARVRVRAACLHYFNAQRQFYGVRLVVPPGRQVDVLSPASDAWAAPVRPVVSLLRYAPNADYEHRVHVEGTVSCVASKISFYLEQEGHGLLVKSPPTQALAVGDVVGVVGFVGHGAHSPFLEDAEIRLLGRRAELRPKAITAQGAVDADAELVTLTGTVTERFATPSEAVLVIAADGTVFSAHLAGGDAEAAWPDRGAQVRLTGVAEPIAPELAGARFPWKSTSFRLRLRTAADVLVLRRPPWWTLTHLLELLVAVFTAALGVVGTLWLRSRFRLQEQRIDRVAAETEMTAVLKERTRLAREMHDTLAQGLTAVNVQLEVAKEAVPRDPVAALAHIETAGQLARSSLEEARRSIRAMRSQLLDHRRLPEAIEAAGRQLLRGTGIEFATTVQGTVRLLPPVLENELLRIALESVTNALKHAHASRITVDVSYAHAAVNVTVTDNGRGLEVTRGDSAGGFGVAGMRERATQFGGTLQVESRPGSGTTIAVSVPLPLAHAL